MRRISSRATFYQKRIFPLVFFGPQVAVFSILVFIGLSSGRYPPIPVLVIPIFMGVIFFFIMKIMVFDLVDEVWDAGDVLIKLLHDCVITNVEALSLLIYNCRTKMALSEIPRRSGSSAFDLLDTVASEMRCLSLRSASTLSFTRLTVRWRSCE